jgi:hypothetical protein
MKIICICNPHTVWKITPGKIYELQDYNWEPSEHKYIIDDRGSKFFFEDGIETYPDYFIPLEQWRERQLNKIGL